MSTALTKRLARLEKAAAPDLPSCALTIVAADRAEADQHLAEMQVDVEFTGREPLIILTGVPRALGGLYA